jgi:DNA-binding NarL/FixJ family response regulator
MHVSKCYWLTQGSAAARSGWLRKLTADHGIDLCETASDADYKILEFQFPGHVVVLEASGDAVSIASDSLPARIAKVLAHGNLPTIICLGNQVPSEAIVDWMRNSIFAYADLDSPVERISKLLTDATLRAASVRERFQRFQVINSNKRSLTHGEKAVLDMILEGVPNKIIAIKLGVSQRTIEARRQKLYQKMGSKSLPGVVQAICEWNQLSLEFEGLRSRNDPPEAMSVKKQLSSEKLSSEEPNSEKLDNEPNKDLMHPSQSVAPPKLQSAVLSQSDSHRV